MGLGDAVLDPPEWVAGSKLIDFASIPAALVALYPVAQQFADRLPFQLPEPPQDWAEPYATLAQDLDLPAAT